MITSPIATLKNCLAEFHMVKGCARERQYMADMNPHLVNWIPIALPFNKWVIWPPPMGAWAFAFMPIACRLNAVKWFYDSIAGFKGPSAYTMTKKETEAKFPQLGVEKKGIKFCAVLHEAQHNDARTNLAIALTAASNGADILNHSEVVEFIKDASGVVTGAKVQDRLSGDSFVVHAKSVIIAGGPYTDGIRRMEVDAGEETAPAVQGGPGVHVVLPAYMCPRDMGLLDYNTSDGRFLFFLPWQGGTIVGTTDKKSDAETEHNPPEDEIQWIVNESCKYLDASVRVRRTDVLSAWRGWRPLAKDPHAAPGAPESRDHIISENPHTGTFFIAGGKWTTWREMAEDAVNKVVAARGLPAQSPCDTLTYGLHGAQGYSRHLNCNLSQIHGVSEDVAQHLAHTYGGFAHDVCRGAMPTGKQWPKHGIAIQEGYPYTECEVRYSVRNEWAVTLKDMVTLRTRLAYLNKVAAQEAMQRIGEVMAEELNWTDETLQTELATATAFLDSFGGPIADKAAAGIRAATAADIQIIFDEIDLDGSGSLDLGEVEAAADRLGFPLEGDGLKEAMVAMDADGNGQVSRAEFELWWNDENSHPQAVHLREQMSLSLEKAKEGGDGVMFG